ncbi:MAG: ATP-binding protein [Patescibacteria group bacterium]
MSQTIIDQFVQNQIGRAPALLKSYVQDDSGNKYVARSIFGNIKNLISDFQRGQREIRMVGVPGLRGVGKTTLLAQTYLDLFPKYSDSLLYISADQVVNELDSNLFSIFDSYQRIIGTSFEKLDHDLFIFIDEIHFDPKWSAVLKTMYDRSKKIFVVCTGSSALSLQSTTDLARRIVFEKLYPMSFTEYMLLKNKHGSKKPKLANQIKQAIFYSLDSLQCYSALSDLRPKVNKYWYGVDRLEIDRYLRFGSMPHSLNIKDESKSQILTSQIVDRVVERDIPSLGKFDNATLTSIKNILLLIAGSSEVSINSLANTLKGISLVTLINVLETLEKAEMLIRIYPYGSAYKKVRKPSKYHFMTPAVRHSLLSIIEGESAYRNHKGKYLEDIVALTLYREFGVKLSSPIFYDSAKGGADFILSLAGKKVAIEVGHGNKDSRQVQATLQKIKGDYGLVISNSQLAQEDNIVKVPLEYFLLM